MPDDNSDHVGGLSRRSFLAGANALVLLGLIDACSGKHHPSSAAASATPKSTSSASSAEAASGDLLAVLRQAVQASPDFLQKAAADAVATRDPATIASFVRDRISVVPSWGKGDDPTVARRWGSAATLRGGSGTLRDRADLLVELLAAAGFHATVMSADRPSSIDLAALYQLRATEFEPDQHLLDTAVKLLPAGTSLPSPSAADSAGSADPAELAAKALAAAIPVALQQAQLRSDLLPASVPVVALGTPQAAAGASAVQQYFFALGDLAPITAPPTGLASAGESQPTPTVHIAVSGLPNPAPGTTTTRGQLVELVSMTWSAEQVFGRQVLLSFVPPSGATGYLSAAADQPVRIPMLRVQTELPAYAAPPITAAGGSASGSASPPPAGSAGDTSNLTVTGTPITLQGDVLSSSNPSGDPTALTQGAYGPMTTLTASQRAAAIASVATMQATATATTFPEITLDVAVLDSSGNSIDGLDAAAFNVTEDATPVPWLELMANAAGPNVPRILVAYDTTGSVAETWPSAAVKASFEQSLAATLVAAAAETPFDVQIVGLDGAVQPSVTAWAPPDQAGVLNALENAGGDDSVVWGAASGTAIDQGATAIIIVSDFQSVGESADVIAADQRRIAAAGVPIVCLPIGTPDEAAISTMITLSGGTRLDPLAPSTPAALAALIIPLVSARTQSSYRLRYPAATSGPTNRTATVTVGGRSAPVATATYAVPSAPATPWSFVGLYVTVNIADIEAETRHLAGLTLTGTTEPNGALDDAAATAETRAAICGLTTIAIEPGTVTTAALFDDVLASMQSVQPILAQPKTATAQQLLAAGSEKGVRRVPPVLLTLLSPGSAETNAAAVPTVRVAILSERGNDAGRIDTHMDLPPTLNTVAPLGSDPAAAFAAGLAVSSQAGAAEAANFDASAFSSLAGQPLTFIAAGDHAALDTFVDTLPAAQQAAWDSALETIYFLATLHILVPTGGSTAAFWVVDSSTGAATAVLLDGSGGAMSDDASTCGSGIDASTLVIDALNLLLAILVNACIALAKSGAGTASSFFCTGKMASAIYAGTGLILVIASGYSGGPWSALASFAGLFIPIAGKSAGAARVGKVAVSLTLTAFGLLPNPCAGPADAGGGGAGPTPATPNCSVNGSEDGFCN
jgi:hypothetical protein